MCTYIIEVKNINIKKPMNVNIFAHHKNAYPSLGLNPSTTGCLYICCLLWGISSSK